MSSISRIAGRGVPSVVFPRDTDKAIDAPVDNRVPIDNRDRFVPTPDDPVALNPQPVPPSDGPAPVAASGGATTLRAADLQRSPALASTVAVAQRSVGRTTPGARTGDDTGSTITPETVRARYGNSSDETRLLSSDFLELVKQEYEARYGTYSGNMDPEALKRWEEVQRDVFKTVFGTEPDRYAWLHLITLAKQSGTIPANYQSLMEVPGVDAGMRDYFRTHAPGEWMHNAESRAAFARIYGAEALRNLDATGCVPENNDPTWVFRDPYDASRQPTTTREMLATNQLIPRAYQEALAAKRNPRELLDPAQASRIVGLMQRVAAQGEEFKKTAEWKNTPDWVKDMVESGLRAANPCQLMTWDVGATVYSIFKDKYGGMPTTLAQQKYAEIYDLTKQFERQLTAEYARDPSVDFGKKFEEFKAKIQPLLDNL